MGFKRVATQLNHFDHINYYYVCNLSDNFQHKKTKIIAFHSRNNLSSSHFPLFGFV